jgi:hypothetical protein
MASPASASSVGELFSSNQPTLDAAASNAGLASISVAESSLIKQRWAVIVVISLIFVGLNAAVCMLIYLAMNAELSMLAQGKPVGERMITNGVFMSLIGATVVQTGLVIKGISDFLFKANAEA